MFLEGQVNWMWVLGAVAAVGWIVGLVALWFAFRNRTRHVSASDQLDLVQRVADDSQKRLFETLNAIPVALVETDRQGKFVFANRAAHQLLGRKVAAVVNFPPRQIGPFMSEVLTLGFPDADGEVVLVGVDRDLPLGGRLF